MKNRTSFRRQLSRLAAAVSLLCIGSLVSACSMLETRPLQNGSSEVQNGTTVYSLPKTLVTVTIPKNQNISFQEMTVATKLIPDPDHTYALNLTPAPLSEDTIVVDVDPDTRFITAIYGTAKDKTADILSEIGKTAARLSGAGLPPFFAAETDRNYVFEFDPSDPSWFARTREQIQGLAGIDMRCIAGCERSAKVPAAPVDAVLVRPARSAILIACAGPCETKPSRVFPIISFNGSQLVAVPIARSPFVERKTKLTFVNGMPTKAEHTKPSEALGLVSIPGQVIGSVFAGLGQAFSDEKAQLENAAALAEAQKGVLDAQANLLRAQNDLQRLQTELKKSSGGGESGDKSPE